MKEVDLGLVVQDAILRFNQRRTMTRPAVALSIPSNLSRVRWQDDSLERLLQAFLFHALLMNDPFGSVRVAVHERRELHDLEAFLQLRPIYWMQVRIEGQASQHFESIVEEKFDDFGYRCEDRAAVESSKAKLAVFSFGTKNEPKLVCCADNRGVFHQHDFLIPVTQPPGEAAVSNERKRF